MDHHAIGPTKHKLGRLDRNPPTTATHLQINQQVGRLLVKCFIVVVIKAVQVIESGRTQRIRLGVAHRPGRFVGVFRFVPAVRLRRRIRVFAA